MRNTPKPHGGLIAYEPESFLNYFKELVTWNMSKIDAVVNVNNLLSGTHTRYLEQLQASMASIHISLIEAHKHGEINDKTYNQIKSILDDVQSFNHEQLGSVHQQLQQISTLL